MASHLEHWWMVSKLLARRTVLSYFSSNPVLSVLFLDLLIDSTTPKKPGVLSELCPRMGLGYWTPVTLLSDLPSFLLDGCKAVVAGAASWHVALVNSAGSTKTGVPGS